MRKEVQTAAIAEIRADSLYRLSEFGRRLGLGERSLSNLQHAGLPTVRVGRLKLVIGADAIQFFQQLRDGGR